MNFSALVIGFMAAVCCGWLSIHQARQWYCVDTCSSNICPGFIPQCAPLMFSLIMSPSWSVRRVCSCQGLESELHGKKKKNTWYLSNWEYLVFGQSYRVFPFKTELFSDAQTWRFLFVNLFLERSEMICQEKGVKSSKSRWYLIYHNLIIRK